jgi:hypothetical protein
MTRNEILQNIKEQFRKMMFAGSLTMGCTTKEGKNLIAMGEDLAVGVEIYQVDDNNVQSPLDNGDYTLTDGRIITVTDNKVANITAPDPAQQEESPVGGASEATNAKMEMGEGMPDGMPTETETPEEETLKYVNKTKINPAQHQLTIETYSNRPNKFEVPPTLTWSLEQMTRKAVRKLMCVRAL